jgi:single-strand DNA-binding protein
MAGSNLVVLIGRITADPEIKFTPNGTPVCRFTLAVDRPKPKDAERAETDFIPVVTFGRLAEVVADNVVKGQQLSVHGRLQIRSYDDREGIRRRAAEVVAQRVLFLAKPRNVSQEAEPAEEQVEEIPF